MAITVFEGAFQKMDESIINILGNQTAALINVISPIILAGFGLYILLIAMSYIKGNAEPIELGFDMIYRFIAWSVILGLALNISNYTSIVVAIVNELPNELAQIVTGTAGTPVINSLDSLLDAYYEGIKKLFADVEFLDVGGYVSAGVITFILLICGLPFIVVAGGFILLSKIMSAVLLVLGPIFIVLALFPATRQYFSLWVGQIVNYMLMLVIIHILAAIQISYLTNIANTSVQLSWYTSLTIGSTSMLFFVVVLKVPDIAGALSNGLAINGFTGAYRGLGGGKSIFGKKKDPDSDKDKGKDKGNQNKIKPENQGI